MKVITCVKNELFIKQYSSHCHSSWEIIYNLDGDVTSVIGNKKYEISKGGVMVIPPGVTHDGKSDGFYRDMFFQADILDFYDVTVVHDSDKSILTLMNMLHKIYTENESNHRQIENNLVDTICSYIKKSAEEDCRYPFVTALKNIIYDNISNPDFSVGEAIADTGFNKDYLRRCFKAVMLCTPLEYLTRLRINQAKTMLIQDAFISVEDVAKNCGFDDSFYFSTCFKKHMGISPMQYRKKFK